MKRIINIIAFCAVASFFTGCGLVLNPNLSSLRTYISCYMVNGSQQDIRIETKRGNNNVGTIYDVAQGDTMTLIQLAQYQETVYDIYDSLEMQYIYIAATLLTDLGVEVPFIPKYYEKYWHYNIGDVMRDYDKCREHIIRIYDSNGQRTREWTKLDTDGRSPYSTWNNQNKWRCVVGWYVAGEEYNGIVARFDCYYTITDDDLIPEESAEE